ncbi:MAG TPA: ABC transporter permease [Archaeoglobaceae archaeon]|nr:ABC transporter permease [Archaeoglobaceae archaeon]
MILKIAMKDLKAAIKERTLMSIVGLQLFVALFASVITFGLLVLYNPGYTGYAIEKEVKVGFVGDAPVLKRVIDPHSTYNSIDSALNDFYDGKIDVIVWLPVENYEGTNIVRLILPKEEIKAIQSSLLLRDKLKDYQYEMREIRGIPSKIELKTYSPEFKKVNVPEDYSITFKFIYVMLIPLLIITTAATAAGMFIDLISEEIETKTAHVLLSTPLSEEKIVQGKILASILLAAILTPTWILLLLLNGIEIRNVFLVMLVSISIAMLFLSISALSVSLSKDRERAQLVFSLAIIGIIPLMFSSPELPALLTSRIAAGSPFQPSHVFIYFAIGIISLIFSSKALRGLFISV